ncbi:hypothetical protein B2I21_09845 [Chryseobacterium mucoviscidosis]|nr:hypothetical protein B2I21_09845 [Chryseobacterium mucoviscidosis]
MKSLKVILGVSLASLSVFSFSSHSFAESASIPLPSEVTSSSNIQDEFNLAPGDAIEIYEVDLKPESMTIQSTTSATFSLSSFGKGSEGNTGTKGEFKSTNSIKWDSSNKKVTLKVRQYEIVKGGPMPVYGSAKIQYDLISQNNNRADALILEGNYYSEDGTLSWSNVKPGTYNLIIKNVGSGFADASGSFSVQ